MQHFIFIFRLICYLISLFLILFIYRNQIRILVMENAFKICFALIPFLILRAFSIVDIKYLDSLKIDYPTTIQTSAIVANGAEWQLYFASQNTLHIYKIDQPTSTSYCFNYYQVTNCIDFVNRIFFWYDYVIVYSTNNVIMNQLIRADLSFQAEFSINQLVDKFYHVPTQAIVIYLTTNGKLCYIHDNVFAITPQSYAIDDGEMSSYSSLTFEVSSDSKYVAISGNSINSSPALVRIYSILNILSNPITEVCRYPIPSNDIGDIAWCQDTQYLLISLYESGIMIKLNVITCLGTQYQIMQPHLYNIVKLTYHFSTKEAIFTGILISNPNSYVTYSFNIDTNSLTFFKEYSTPSDQFSFEDTSENQNNFTLRFTNTLLFFQYIESCDNGLVYDLDSYTCGGSQNVVTNSSTNNTSLNVTNATVLTNYTSSNDSALTNNTSLNVTNSSALANSTISNDSALITNNTSLNVTNSPELTNSTSSNDSVLTNNTSLNTTSLNDSVLTNTTNNTDLNSSLLINNTSLNQSLNPTQISNLEKIKNFQGFMSNTLDNQAIAAGNLIPGARKILQPLFIFFVNIDDLWLYNYHEREYDIVVTSVFNSVQKLQNQKWSLFQFQKIWPIIGLNSNTTIQQLSFKYNYSSWKFIQVQQNSNGFLLNSLNFFGSNVFIMFIMFVVFRILFFLLFNYRISILFRQYSFWLYFLMMVLEGNVQYLTYLFTFEMKNFFSFNFINKIALCFSSFLYFTIFISAVAAFPIIKHQYGRFISYFTQNLRVCLVSFVYFTIQTGYRNILLGFLHIMFESNYKLKIGALILTQILFLVFTVILIASARIFMNHLKVWFNIIAAMLRILIIFTFLFDKNSIGTDFQSTYLTIFYIYFLQMYVVIGIQLLKIAFESVKFLKGKKTVEQQLKVISKVQKAYHKSKKLKVEFIRQDFLKSKTIKRSKISQNKNDETFEQNQIKKPLRFRILNSSMFKQQQPQQRFKIKIRQKNGLKNRMFRQDSHNLNIKQNTNIYEMNIQ